MPTPGASPQTPTSPRPDARARRPPPPWTLTSAALAAITLLLYLTITALTSKSTPSGQTTRPRSAPTPLPQVVFADVTPTAGIQFSHTTGAAGEKLLPETMGGGCAFFDVDNDGDQDLLLVDSAPWPWTPPARRSTPGGSRLFLNDGTGRFSDATDRFNLGLPFYGMGVAAGDFDNDGWVDLYISGVGAARLLQNQGGTRFADVTPAAGVGLAPEEWGTSCAWIDIDNDGDLDLYVGLYVRWSREIDLNINYQLAGIGRAYGPPMNFPGSFPKLFRNEGGGRFKDVSAASGLQITNSVTGMPLAKSLGVAPVDLNRDGWIDLIVANDTVQNFVFTNRHNGTFHEVGAISGIAFDSFGAARGAMGIDAARFQEDDALGISIGNFANEMTALYVSKRDTLAFSDEAIAQGIGDASRLSLTFGVFFFDYDLDGWLDLLTVNGHIEEAIALAKPGQSYRQPPQLFWNLGGANRGTGGFAPVPATHAGPDLSRPLIGRGSAYADIDGDGDLDVLLTQCGGPPLLLRNDQKLGHRWLRLKLEGRTANRNAIGSWIHLRSNARSTWRHVMPTRGYLSQSELPVTIGLGTHESLDDLEILWPDGSRERISPLPPLNKTTTVRQTSAH